MAILPIIVLPNPVLRGKANKIKKSDKGINQLVENMIDTMRDANGVGLAANQIGILQRIAVIQLPDEEKVTVLINPELIEKQGERQIEEGCLSLPGYQGLVNRSEKVSVKAMDLNWKKQIIHAEGLMAQALEHEIDHLNGNVYVEKLVSKDKIWKIKKSEE
tara:strand:- start:1399 stop:1881 length:483 start_codon:yes stop_codon:yes gene_type:complete